MSLFESAGSYARTSFADAGYSVNLLLRTVLQIGYLPRRFRFLFDVAHAAGVRALPVTMIVALFSGMILALQTGIALLQLGQNDLIGQVLSLSMCREMGPFITAVILAATVGSAIAAELGTMTVSEETTALDVMSIDVTNYLVLPRVVGLTIMCPLVTVFANLIGILGGSFVAQAHLSVSWSFYWNSVQESLTTPENFLPKDVFVGLFKAMVFGCLIAVVSCAAGLRADGGALGVGRAVQRAVMTSVILVIVFGYIITWYFYFLGASK